MSQALTVPNVSYSVAGLVLPRQLDLEVGEQQYY
jgi:hypothetical protein